jgi:hypothetical protein
MPDPGAARLRGRGHARWQVPEVDERALALARHLRRAIAQLTDAGQERWVNVLEPQLGPLEDGDVVAVRGAANRIRSTFGVGESVAEELPEDAGRALRDATDALVRALDRHEARVPRSSDSTGR